MHALPLHGLCGGTHFIVSQHTPETLHLVFHTTQNRLYVGEIDLLPQPLESALLR
jgi:hypothetical protein